jgi:hypothetical protein
MKTSEKARQLAESYAGLSADEQSEFVSLVSPEELARLAVRISERLAQTRTTDAVDFSQAMDKVFGHHAPLLGKLAR